MKLEDLVRLMLRNRAAWTQGDQFRQLLLITGTLEQMVEEWFRCYDNTETGRDAMSLRCQWIGHLLPQYLSIRDRFVARGYSASTLQTPDQFGVPGATPADRWLTVFSRTPTLDHASLLSVELRLESRVLSELAPAFLRRVETDSGLNGAMVTTREEVAALLTVARRAWGAVAAYSGDGTSLGWGQVHPLTATELASVVRAAERFGCRHGPVPTAPSLEAATIIVGQMLADLNADSEGGGGRDSIPHGSPAVATPTYSPRWLADMLEIDGKTLRKYAIAVGVETPRRGGRDFRYGSDQSLLIIAHAERSGPPRTRICALKAANQVRAESENKPAGGSHTGNKPTLRV